MKKETAVGVERVVVVCNKCKNALIHQENSNKEPAVKLAETIGEKHEELLGHLVRLVVYKPD